MLALRLTGFDPKQTWGEYVARMHLMYMRNTTVEISDGFS